jgi:hypothetical protein
MRLRLWIRRIGAILGTVALGALIGFIVPTMAAEYAPAPPHQPLPAGTSQSSTNQELPIARAFIDAFVVNDQTRLKELGAAEIDTVKANDLAQSVQQVGQPVLLGSIGGPGISIQAYASVATMNDGSKTILSWRVVTTSGRAGLVLPPSGLDPRP